ncbi:MAG TPA: hypothetical protein VGJ07_23815 [Rugosimonospora sp.]
MDTETRCTAAKVDEATTTGRVPMCWWCSVAIVRDPNGNWVHTNRAYTCKDPRFGWLPHTAQPRPTRVLPLTGRRAI